MLIESETWLRAARRLAKNETEAAIEALTQAPSVALLTALASAARTRAGRPCPAKRVPPGRISRPNPLGGDGRVNIKGDISGSGTIAAKGLAVAQVLLHHAEGRNFDAAHAPGVRTGEVRQDAVLFEGYVAQGLSPLQLPIGEVGRALGVVEENCAGLS